MGALCPGESINHNRETKEAIIRLIPYTIHSFLSNVNYFDFVHGN
jgi:hypothetical protein